MAFFHTHKNFSSGIRSFRLQGIPSTPDEPLQFQSTYQEGTLLNQPPNPLFLHLQVNHPVLLIGLHLF